VQRVIEDQSSAFDLWIVEPEEFFARRCGGYLRQVSSSAEERCRVRDSDRKPLDDPQRRKLLSAEGFPEREKALEAAGLSEWGMSQENVEIVKRAVAAYGRRDYETMRELNHPDLELDWSASLGLDARVYQGRERVLSFYENYLETFEEIDIQPDRFIESGDWVVVPNTGLVRGRDGIETVARSAFAFEVQDGLITRIRLYQETQEALEAVGLQK
jgi:ketosteroid isomerase-like protein